MEDSKNRLRVATGDVIDIHQRIMMVRSNKKKMHCCSLWSFKWGTINGGRF